LRFLQDREFERLGSTKTTKVDVRIIAATNRDLAAAVGEGMFRQDLYYRLNVFPIRVPSLRERREDVRALINFFNVKVCREYGCELKFTASAMDVLQKYSWPGNVREMENLVERLAIITEGAPVDPKHLSPYVTHVYKGLECEEDASLDSLTEMEKRGVVAALERNNWIQSRAARDLGITLRQMGYRVKKFGLETVLKQRRSLS
jgi:Nif-specific regulatory protein